MGSVLSSVFFFYETTRSLRVQNKVVGLAQRFIQLVIVSYTLGWVIIYNNGYQENSTIQSTVKSKVRGGVITNFSSLISNPEFTNRIWDAADYVIPSQEDKAFFVLTNVIVTPYQTMGRSSMEPGPNTICNSSDDCPTNQMEYLGTAVRTGKCVKYNETLKTCEIQAWLPIPKETLSPPYDKRPLLQGTEKFTVLIKNSIYFTKWPSLKTRNIASELTNEYLENCKYDENNRLCPIFILGEIVKAAGENYTELATKGAVIGITINWNCNLDYNIKNCLPVYTFRRLDCANTQIARGWNFKYAQHHNATTRTLFKAFGIHFICFVEGSGRRFHIITLFLNIGTGLALLKISTVICDFLLSYYLTKKERDKKCLDLNSTIRRCPSSTSTRALINTSNV